MKKNNSTQTKPKRNHLLKACSWGLALTIIGLIGSGFMVLGPVAPGAFGLLLVVLLVFIILLCSVCTAFIVWASEGFRNFIANFWGVIANCFNATEQITSIIQSIFPYAALACGLLVIAGFVLNLIGYLKNKDNNKQKGKFIAVTIMLGIALILIIVTAVVIY